MHLSLDMNSTMTSAVEIRKETSRIYPGARFGKTRSGGAEKRIIVG
jgi:hypothetical protein